jgi:hypothetical protein
MGQSRHVRICQCCGFPLAQDEVAWLFRGKQRRIFEALARAGNAGLSREQLLDRVYWDDPEGGPLTARGVIAVMICQQMNPKLEPFGLQIKGLSGRGSWPYRLTTLRANGH